jgi:two-component system NarL family sensor kinase
MPGTLNEISPEQLNEIPIAIITVMVMFLSLIMIGAFFLVRYQKKKYQYRQSIFEIQKENEAAILRSQLEIQEQTFDAISLEIHDNVGQILSLAKVQLNIAQSLLTDPTGILTLSKENISRAMTDLRDIAKGLSTERINQLDLAQAIMHETERINKTKYLSCLVEVTGNAQIARNNKKLVIFRMVQETLNNVLKHSGASTVHIHLNYGEQELEIIIKDNGSGFIMEEKMQEGLGLQNIRSRAALIGDKRLSNLSPGKVHRSK